MSFLFTQFKSKRKRPGSRDGSSIKRSRSLNEANHNRSLPDDAINLTDESKNFWKLGNYKYAVERCESGFKLGNELIEMITDRAIIEEVYAKSLKEWHKKHTNYLKTKSDEYNTSKDSWQALLNTGNLIAEIHMDTSKQLIENASGKIKNWLKKNYEKRLFGLTKEAKEFEVI